MHLLVGVAFFMPVVAASGDLKGLGGGTLRYAVALPSALTLGALIVLFEWKLGKAAWLKSQRYPKKTQDLIGVSIFALQLLCTAIGAVFGTKLATLVAEHIGR
jgi:hypothetical protein